MSSNSDSPFAQMVLPPRMTLPKKITQETKERGEVRRRIEYLKDPQRFREPGIQHAKIYDRRI